MTVKFILEDFEREEILEYLKMIQEASELKEKTRWIPVSVAAKAPEKGGTYLVTVHNERMFESGYGSTTAYYNKRDNQWVPDDEWITGEVVAWMPIPEPYKPENEESEE